MLIRGDLNARTGSLPDYCTELGNIHIFGQNFAQNITSLPRYNSDKSGREILQLCQSLGLYIVNSRLRGDSLDTILDILFAHFNSTVDYMVSDLDPFSLSAFTVKPLTPLSDHSQITVFLKRTNNTTPPQPSKLFNIKKSCRWAENSTEEFQKALSTPEIQTLLDTFLDTTYVHRKR